jgi:hypothetical protein
MAIDPPYRLDPLQNPVNVKGRPEGEEPVPEPGLEDCWNFQTSLFITACVQPTLAWPTCNPRPIGEPQCTPNPAEAAGCFPQCKHWYVDGQTIVCYEYAWLSGADCGFTPGPLLPPPEPPDDWIGFDFSPNSSE